MFKNKISLTFISCSTSFIYVFKLFYTENYLYCNKNYYKIYCLNLTNFIILFICDVCEIGLLLGLIYFQTNIKDYFNFRSNFNQIVILTISKIVKITTVLKYLYITGIPKTKYVNLTIMS